MVLTNLDLHPWLSGNSLESKKGGGQRLAMLTEDILAVVVRRGQDIVGYNR